MAMARPVVSTRVGAEGLEIQPGREMLLADTPTDFADQVLWVLDHPAPAAALAQTGQAFVRERYDWQHIIPRLEQVYSALIQP
jgi:glycosyltransferase involved in cell wall biosynthesis